MRTHNHNPKVTHKTLLDAFGGDKDKLDAAMIALGKGKPGRGLILRDGKVWEFQARDKFAKRITIIREYRISGASATLD